MDTRVFYDGLGDDSPALSPTSPIFGGYVLKGSTGNMPYFMSPGIMPSYSTFLPQPYTVSPRGGPEQHLLQTAFPLDYMPPGDDFSGLYQGTLVSSSSSPSADSPPLYRDEASPRFSLQAGPRSTLVQDPESLLSPVSGTARNGPESGSPVSIKPESRVARKGRKNATKRRRTPDTTLDNNRESTPNDEQQSPSRPTRQLRTASRAPKKYSEATSHKKTGSPQELTARAAHNQVEQQYRKRLNSQFEMLLAVLPLPHGEGLDPDEGEDGDDRRENGADKRISKAEVLDLARRRIKLLEKERASLQKEKRELAGDVYRLQAEWSRRLGGT